MSTLPNAVKEGEIVSVKVLSIDAQGKISLQLVKK